MSRSPLNTRWSIVLLAAFVVTALPAVAQAKPPLIVKHLKAKAINRLKHKVNHLKHAGPRPYYHKPGGQIGNPVFADTVVGLSAEVTPGPGIRIVHVRPGSYAAHAGLEVGDRIYRINNVAIHGSADFYQALRAHDGHAHMRVRNVRNGHIETHYAYLPVTGVVIPAPPTPAPPVVDLDGWWKSNLGNVRLFENGPHINGKVYLANGTEAVLEGTRNGNTLTLSWFISPQQFGTANLSVDSWNHQIAGDYQSAQGATGQWTLNR